MTTVEELIKLPPFSYPVPADSMSRTLAFALLLSRMRDVGLEPFSEYVRQEIKLAHDSGVRIIPVFHNGYTDTDLRRAMHEGDETATILESRQGIVVQNERSLGVAPQ